MHFPWHKPTLRIVPDRPIGPLTGKPVHGCTRYWYGEIVIWEGANVESVLAHETCHWMQYKHNWLHPWLYRWLHDYRLYAEVKAWAEQIRVEDQGNGDIRGLLVSKYAKRIAQDYGLNVTPTEVEKLLKDATKGF